MERQVGALRRLVGPNFFLVRKQTPLARRSAQPSRHFEVVEALDPFHTHTRLLSMQCSNRLTWIGGRLCQHRSSGCTILLSYEKRRFSQVPYSPACSYGFREFAAATRSLHAKTISPQNRSDGTLHTSESTIFALSSAPGKAAIAVIRCSGPACSEIYHALCPSKSFPEPRRASLRKLYSPSERSLLDPGALILYFPPPATVTGEPVLELHVHGGNATVRAVLSAISSISSPAKAIRYAEPGEFTRRAFYHNRLDLTQVEALGDTLAAETEQQRQLALKGSTDVLAQRYDNWRQQLLGARGELEALIDFSEDQHFDESPAQLAQSVAAKVAVLLKQIDASLSNAARGELLRNGIKVALLGAPNVGKSSLLNLIVGREAAIVSSEAGTTRDVVETNVDIGGFFCNFGDLAGLRDGAESGFVAAGGPGSIGKVEEEGIRRAKARALDADVVVVVHACERDARGNVSIPLTAEVADTLSKLDPERQRIIHVINKVDLAGNAAQVKRLLEANLAIGNGNAALLCCKSDAPTAESGLKDLLCQLTAVFEGMTQAVGIPGIPSTASGSEVSLGASERQARLLETCQGQLQLFIEAVDIPTDTLAEEVDVDIVVAAETLRVAAECLAKITGRGEGGDVEDVLGVVFENFCVGK